MTLLNVPGASALRFEFSRTQVAVPVVVGSHDLVRSHVRLEQSSILQYLSTDFARSRLVGAE